MSEEETWSARAAALPARAKAIMEVKVLPAIEPATGWLVPPLRGRRYRARRMGSYDEWTVIYDPVVDVQQPDPELIDVLLDAATRARANNLSKLEARAGEDPNAFPVNQWPNEHYRLLVALAEATDARVAVDIGTATGASALSFLEASSIEEVHTFDLKPWREFSNTLLRETDFDRGLHQHIADLGSPSGWAEHVALLDRADIIFMDGPKDGLWEAELLRLLVENVPAKRQLLVVDDIKVMTMVDWWRDFPLPKVDASSLGHWSGTGLAYRG